MARVSDHFTPVGPHEVVAALDGGAALPHDAVWVTFDDGDASVVDHGLPALLEHAVPATMFVCPGLVNSQEPFWWEIADRAVDVGLDRSVAPPEGLSLTTWLKQVPDGERRAIVKACSADVYAARRAAGGRRLGGADLDAWQAAGHTLGNHSWDHPCLDRCPDDEQVAQIRRAHDWLTGTGRMDLALFAYPNGNRTPTVERDCAHSVTRSHSCSTTASPLPTRIATRSRAFGCRARPATTACSRSSPGCSRSPTTHAVGCAGDRPTPGCETRRHRRRREPCRLRARRGRRPFRVRRPT